MSLSPSDVADGTLALGHNSYVIVVPAPLSFHGNVEIRLLLQNSTELVIRATQVDLLFEGELPYVEAFAEWPSDRCTVDQTAAAVSTITLVQRGD